MANTEKPTNYRLYMNVTSKGENTKIVTQDIFTSIELASQVLHSACDDLSKKHKNFKHGSLLTFEPKTQDDGIDYVGQMNGTFTGGKLFMRIITTDNEPDEENITAQEIKGRFVELTIPNLGEFKFLFKENVPDPDNESQGKYYMEVFWNPCDYGILDFLDGYYVDDIDETMEDIKNDMIEWIRGVRISCESHIENGTDDEGVYQDVLDYWV